MRLCLHNVENLYLLFDTIPTGKLDHLSEKEWQLLSTSVYDNKPLQKCLDLAKAYKQIDADVIMLCEVGGLESLTHFNNLFLDNLYHPCLIEGNSERQLDVGFLIKKTAPFYFDISTNRNRLINFLYPHEIGQSQLVSHKFSRDVSELRLFTKDKEKPFLLLLHCHLKSPRDPDRIDPNGFERRQAELKAMIEIYKEHEDKHKGQLPILISGDLNGNASPLETDPEFSPIYQQTKLRDSLELAKLPLLERSTYYQVRSSAQTKGKQIDFCFLNEKLQTYFKSSFVYRYKNHLGKEFDMPYNLSEKTRLPSDHYPVVLDLQNIPLD